jgi:hypothetical protein
MLDGLAALGRQRGLVMLDGHEDVWPPPLSQNGEASHCELDRWGPLLGPSNVALRAVLGH